MSNILMFPEKFYEVDKFNSKYEDDDLNFEWEFVNKSIVSNCNGYNGNKYINTEYNFKEMEKEEVFSGMDNNKLLEKYIDKMDRDQSDLRNDIRASENRTARNIELLEERNIERLNRIEQIINDHNAKIDEKYEKLESKIDSNNKFIISLSISTIIGIAAMVIAVILAVR
jgi:hypothetical protein